jgi:predicted SnoaL-like aldol condensation-catalyzing enzyme
VSAYTEAVVVGGNLGVLGDYVAVDVDRPANPNDGIEGLRASLEVLPRDDIEIHAIVADDSRVGVLYTRADATIASGRFEGLDVYEVNDGLIVSVLELASTANNAAADRALPPTLTMEVGTAPDDEMLANQQLVLSFIDDLFGKADPTAVDRYVADGYLQHNPMVAPGPDGLRALVANTGPSTLEGFGSGGQFMQGDFVINVSLLPVGENFYLVDLFRVEDGLLIEHWDFTPVGTALPSAPSAPPATTP